MPVIRSFGNVALVAGVVLLGGSLLLVPGWVGGDDFPWSTLAGWLKEQDSADHQARELERKRLVEQWRNHSKKQVKREVVEGRLSLLEGAAWFRRLNSQPEDAPFPFMPECEGSREEQACRQVIAWSQPKFGEDTDTEIMQRLQREFQQARLRPGALVLPTPPDLPELMPCP
jgi:hypothetical protein